MNKPKQTYHSLKQPERSSNPNISLPKMCKTSHSKNRQKFVYSSTKSKSIDVQNSQILSPALRNNPSKLQKQKQCQSSFKQKHQLKLRQIGNRKYNKSITLKRTIKTIQELPLNRTIMTSIKIIKQHKLNTQFDIIKNQADFVLKQNSRQNRIRLVDVLEQLHPFFSKIHRSIAQAVVLLGRLSFYYKGDLIFETLGNPFAELNTQSITLDKSNRNARSKQDIGFVLYGKVQLCNDRVFYSHFMNNHGTLFQTKFIRREDKIEYYGKVLASTMVLWLPKDSYYIIRKQCFLSLDLKYMFGEFQNMLKYNMVHKNLPSSNQI